MERSKASRLGIVAIDSEDFRREWHFGELIARSAGLSGAIVGVSAAALSGRPMYVPTPVARAVYVILGISLGSSVTPETVATMAAWPCIFCRPLRESSARTRST